MAAVIREGALGADLYKHLVDELFSVPSAQRLLSRWAMNAEWFEEVVKLASAGGPMPDVPAKYLMGLSFEVREDAGLPHLEMVPDLELA